MESKLQWKPGQSWACKIDGKVSNWAAPKKSYLSDDGAKIRVVIVSLADYRRMCKALKLYDAIIKHNPKGPTHEALPT